MSVPPGFLRVSKSRPCPICHRAGWCLISNDEPTTKAVCKRVESKQTFGDAGWLHRLRDDGWRPACGAIRSRRVMLARAVPDLREQAERFQHDVHPGDLAALAGRLGLTVASLKRLGIGWTGWAWSFPMSDVSGRVVGIRLRRTDGSKLAVSGGHEGVFVPTGLTDSTTLLIAEGATDTAALLDLGFDAIGRPSCSGGTRIIREMVRDRRPSQVVVFADADVPGQAGAQVLCVVLASLCPDVRIVTPPAGIKDARAWAMAGAKPQDVQRAIDAATPVKLWFNHRSMTP